MSCETYHIPVLLEECLEHLAIKESGTYIDLTMGGGGHTREILARLGEGGKLYSLDPDPDAQANAPQDEHFEFVASNFRFVRGAMRLRGVEQVDGILADLGVSSHHFDAKHRGFSFRGDAPLDMRMNTRGGRTAADIVNGYDKDALARIFAEYGELETTWKIANCIERARSVAPITTTAELVEAVKACTPPKDEAKFLTKLFQALRLELNGEMEALKMALEQSLKVLNPEGRLVVMSYHSLEDRIVKNFMRSGNTEGRVEKDFFGRSTTPLKVITRKAVVPTDEEININPRSRSAKLRVAEKI
jgi:16S rRNA (cytosine1402-N4)-methyltransferase